MKKIEIYQNIFISEDEFVFKASRSSGPGGQNVNKLNTRISLFFNVKECNSFSDYQKKRILKCLSTIIDKEGFIRVVSQKFRTQKANRQAALERLQKLLENAIKPKSNRRKTTIPYKEKQKRLDEKKRRGYLKKQRADKDFDF